MNNKIIGRFIPVNNFNRGYAPFNVITKEQSSYLPPSWEGIREDGEKYHVAEFAWRFEPMKWDGDGLPPVGCRVEANYGGEWVEATVAYTERPEAHGDAVAWKEVLVFDSKTTRPFWTDEFRPIRSEADKKRDESIKALKFSFGAFDVNGLADMVYQAIASGKIPHIRIN
ncbi:hypothetical protein G3X29_002928 [Salmonella enterica]|nr:hypothetical protein [Salmonella enterica]EIT4267591.1 hypothetical protein [Salmonella enterica subsp. enterica serovar Give]EIT4365704.1 hypothetical protein [Salmonella enterica subsp. enterica serovar Give]